ncbi:hypothetical protein HGRIS_008127 [Hohenbuehelia grisea]|uniref:Lipid droplet-associated hydrolase n=1 Tax=Hohenbuehelia grisea TaxID=104357 RepID=A0ABR3J710_9AGAR
MALPPFLKSWDGFQDANEDYTHALFEHPDPIGPTHSLWWAPRDAKQSPSKIILFIPGNPGLVEFYIPFLSAIHVKDKSGRLAILAHSHIGHTPGVARGDSIEYFTLPFQVKSALEAFDAVKSTYGRETSVVLIGHSVGSWVALQILKARGLEVTGLFLLFPTISHIASTPNGRSLSWLFPQAHLIATVSRILRILPVHLLISIMFRSWPQHQLLVLEKFLRSPNSIYASLAMAHDEMESILELDVDLLQSHCHRIWLYFAEKDDWVGNEKETILRSFIHDAGTVRVVHDEHGTPHAYCINHGEQIASQCSEWLEDSVLPPKH